MSEVVKVGDVLSTTPPVPVEAAVEPVPPEEVGRAEPDRPNDKVPVEVMGPPLTDRKGADAVLVDMDVTVPEPGAAGVCHDREEPLEVRTVPMAPTVVRPVPPLLDVRAVPRVRPELMVAPVNVGAVLRTFEPDPVEVVTPVPPLATASVPVKLMVGVAPPEEARGAEAETEVIVPAVGVV